MTGLVTHKLQEAVYAALAADEALSLRLSGVYDQPVTGASYPYLMMGDTNMAQNSVKDIEGVRISFDILLWSDEPSQMEVKELMALADAVLHENDLSVVGADLVQLRLQNAGVMRQFNEQGSLYRGRLSYSATLYNAN